MAVNSQEKHLRGHQDFAAACRTYGFGAVHCRKGKLDCRGLPGLSVSIRRTERLRMDTAMAQASAEAQDKLPILAHRGNRQPWRITMDLDTFFLLYRAFIRTPPHDPEEPEAEPCHGSDPVPVHLPAESPAPQVF